ncbi:hypothetical protein GOFOIKOB_5690 [Methylobacterium tardum]|nr:hypothetical protein [Methylobacterium tardum]GJE52617.1 hypothetical protein GOFOIKOB_5690 [Methylobacterium tardum]
MLKDQALRDAVCGIQSSLEVLGDPRNLLRLGMPDSRLGHARVEKKLHQLGEEKHLQVGVVALWPMTQDQVFQVGERSYSFSIRAADQLADCDIIFINWNYFYGKPERLQDILKLLHDEAKPRVGIIWLIDHHHEFEQSLRLAFEFDFYVHAHPTRVDYLRSVARNCLGLLPCCFGQWEPLDVEAFAGRYMVGPRVDALYGGFRGYNDSFSREAFLRTAIERIPGNNLFLIPYNEPNESHRYFSKSGEEQFEEWCRHKTSAVLAVNEDVPIRLFDALATGQIPIVSDDVQSLEMILPPADQLALPVLRYRAGDVDDLERVHREAVRLFDAGGEAGAWRRHRYAVAQHSYVARLRTLAEMLEVKIAGSFGHFEGGQIIDRPAEGSALPLPFVREPRRTPVEMLVAEEIQAGVPIMRCAVADEVAALESRLAVADEREQAVRAVLRALIVSLRWFGLDRSRFRRCVEEEGQDTPNDGPAAIRHTVLYQEARRVLREAP